MSVSISLSVLTYSPSRISLSLCPFLLSFTRLFLCLCPSFVVIEGGSCGRQQAHTDAQRLAKSVEEIEGRNGHGPSCIRFSHEGLCQPPLTTSLLFLLVCCLCVCLKMDLDVFCVWLTICAGCWAGGGLVIFSSAPSDLVLVLNQA